MTDQNRSADPAAHEAHETPLAHRIVERAIRDWLDTAAGLARATAGSPTREYERGFHAGIDAMRHMHLDNWWYTVTPAIVAELDRAGLLPREAGTTTSETAGQSHLTPAGGQNDHGIVIEDNQSRDCFSIRQDNHDGSEDLIHFCDWPALRAAIDKHQSERTGDW